MDRCGAKRRSGDPADDAACRASEGGMGVMTPREAFFRRPGSRYRIGGRVPRDPGKKGSGGKKSPGNTGNM